MEKLHFLTAGMPLRTDKKKGYEDAFNVLDDMNLDGIEVEFVQGVRMSDRSKKLVKEASDKYLFTAHGPFFPRRPPQVILIPFAPSLIVLLIAIFIARRKDTRLSSWPAMFSATS